MIVYYHFVTAMGGRACLLKKVPNDESRKVKAQVTWTRGQERITWRNCIQG